MKRLSQETVVAIHSELIAQSGGLDGIRDADMLDASINSPYHTFDGNKRIGILSMLVFLDINGLPVTCTDD
jgi:death on curing protein